MAASFLLTFFTILNIFDTISADSCTAIDGFEGCACMMKQGNKSLPVSLQDLVGNNTKGEPIRFDIGPMKDGWAYAYHPCGTFNKFLDLVNPKEGDYGCKQASVGRFTGQSAKQCEGLGDLSDAEFAYNDNITSPVISKLTLTFVNKTLNHAARISLVCNKTLEVEETQFKYLNTTQGPIQYYDFSLTGPCSCPGGCKLTKPKPKPSSAMSLIPNIGFVITLSVFIGFFKF